MTATAAVIGIGQPGHSEKWLWPDTPKRKAIAGPTAGVGDRTGPAANVVASSFKERIYTNPIRESRAACRRTKDDWPASGGKPLGSLGSFQYHRPRMSGPTLRQLKFESRRYAQFYFDPIEQRQMLEGRDACDEIAVIAVNRFVPVAVEGAGIVLRKFVRGRTLDNDELSVLRAYWDRLSAAAHLLSQSLAAGEPAASAAAAAQSFETWPAVGVVTTEAQMVDLLDRQFELIRVSRIAWVGVDSSTHTFAAPRGAYIYVDWFWHGV